MPITKRNNIQVSRRDVLIGMAVATALPSSGTAEELPSSMFERPFAARSLWNSYPIDPILGKRQLPSERNRAYINQDRYGTKVFRASVHDGSMVVHGRISPRGPWVADELRNRKILIPHFPEDVQPAQGSDGHCEIFDSSSLLLHSFHGLSYDVNDKIWRANKYTVSRADESGWGTPSVPDGPRAAGVSTAGGLLRAHEVALEMPPHALAIAAHANVFRSGPQFPATLEDRYSNKDYSGDFPMGALFMLPRDFNINRLHWPNSRRIARTLMTYGARLVDQTHETFSFFGEIGSEWTSATFGGKWQPSWEADLSLVRDSLRMVIGSSRWLDANGVEFVPIEWSEMNLLSMRGPWILQSGQDIEGAGFDCISRNFIIPESVSFARYQMGLTARDEKQSQPWFQWTSGRWYINPEPLSNYRVVATGFGNISASFHIRSIDWKRTLLSIHSLRPGEQAIISTPAEGIEKAVVVAEKPPGPPAGIKLELIKA